jgi:hypothetical protein
MKRAGLLIICLLATLGWGQEIRRPTTETDSLTGAVCNSGGGTTGVPAMPNFYDSSGESTSSTDGSDWGDTIDNLGVAGGKIYSGFPAASGSYSALNLIVYSSCTHHDGSSLSNAGCAVQYSTNNGSTWTTDYFVSNTTNHSLVRDTISLSTSQDLTQLKVRWCTSAVDNGSTDSYYTLAGYDIRTEGTLSSPTAATPSFSPSTGTYNNVQSVTISDGTSGATICYTTDGSTPTGNGAGSCTHGSTYSSPVSISSTGTTLEAIASKSGYLDSSVYSATYTLTVSPAPGFSPVAGTYGSSQSVTISTTAPNSPAIYYNTTGSPTCASTQYTGAVTVSVSETLYAIACATGFNSSTVTSAAYTITGTVANPQFSISPGVYLGTQSVSLTDSTTGAIICYRTDGNNPTTNGSGGCGSGSTQYSSAIGVSSTTTIKAIATKNTWTDSSVVSGQFVIASGNQPRISVAMQ